MAKRILFICSTKNWGGTEKDALLRADELQKRGHLVKVYSSSEIMAKKCLEKEIAHDFIITGGDFNPVTFFRYYQFIKQFKPDILFLTLIKDYWLGGLSAYLLKIQRVVLFLGIERETKKKLKYYLIYKKFSHAIIVNSEQIKTTFLKSCNYLKPQDIFVIVNGFPIPIYKKTELNSLKTNLKINQNSILIGACGRLTHQKGFDLIPQFIAGLKDEYNVYIAVLGEGEDRVLIESEIKKYGVESHVFLLGFQEDTAAFYQNIDLFILFSRFEGMANVLNEAMSYCKEVITTNVSGASELLENGTLGDIVAIDDVKALQNSFRTYVKNGRTVDNPKLISHIATHYSIKQMIDKTELAFAITN